MSALLVMTNNSHLGNFKIPCMLELFSKMKTNTMSAVGLWNISYSRRSALQKKICRRDYSRFKVTFLFNMLYMVIQASETDGFWDIKLVFNDVFV